MKKSIFIVLIALLLNACAQQPHLSDQDTASTVSPDQQQALDQKDIADDVKAVANPGLRQRWDPVAIKIKLRNQIKPRNPIPPISPVTPVSAKPRPGGRAFSKNGLWAYMQKGFRLTDLEHPRISKHINSLSGKPRYIRRLSRNAQPFLHYIVHEMDKRKMPMELALLPMVESAYKPMALSPGKAAGLWQIIPSTGDYFKLERNDWYDTRYELKASTRVALDYLKYLHKFFKKDWLLAMAAYNCGEGTVLKAIKKNKAAGKPTDFWSLDLPSITKEYVPKILALSQIVANPKHYGVKLQPVADNPYLYKVQLGPEADFPKLVAVLGKGFYHYNAAFKQGVTPPAGSHEILLPRKQALALKAETGIKIAAASTRRQAVAKHHHQVKRGDTLSGIAKRYGVSYKQLARWNDLRSSSILRPGQKLVIRATPTRT